MKYFNIVLSLLIIVLCAGCVNNSNINSSNVASYMKVVEYMETNLGNKTNTYIFDVNDLYIANFGSFIKQKDVNERFMSKLKQKVSDPYYYVANEFLGLVDSTLNDSKYIRECAEYLRNIILPDSIYDYIINLGIYGNNIQGANVFSLSYFGKDVNHITDKQIDFVVEALGNPSISVNDFEGIGDVSGLKGYEVSAVKSLVSSELTSKMSGIDLSGANVKLGIDVNLQSEVQNYMDRCLSSFTEMNTDGSNFIDCSIIVHDNRLGLLSAYVPSRSNSSSIFRMNTGNFVDNYSELTSKIMNEKMLSVSLLNVNDVKNDDIKDAILSLKDLFCSQRLSNKDSEHLCSALDISDILFSGNINYRTPSAVFEIKENDNQKYYYKQNSMNSACIADPLLCEFFSNKKKDNTEYGCSLTMPTGIISFTVNEYYTAVVLIGTSSNSKKLDSEILERLCSINDGLYNLLDKHYGESTKTLWSVQDIAEIQDIVYTVNYNTLSDYINSSLIELDSIKINSVENRQLFEDRFEQFYSVIDYYRDSLGQENFNIINNNINKIRVTKREDLLEYSA